MRSSRFALVLSSLLVVSACGSSSGDDDDDDDVIAADADPNAPDSDPTAPDAAPGEWVELITGSWTLAAGTESYTCVYFTVENDVWFDGVEAIAPLGTHHTVLSMGPPQGADRTVPCNAATNYTQIIYASGVGTDRFTFPEGVGTRVPGGTQLLLNLHLFNFSESPLSGMSGNLVHLVNPNDVEHEAELILAGKMLSLRVPPGESTQNGVCAMSGDTNVFALIPHMHMLGSHMKVTLESSEMGDLVVHDESYSFDEQFVNQFTPVPMKAGDRMLVDCSYNNTTGSDVFFGDSSLQEMCFALTFRYPALSGSAFCAN